MAVDRDGEHARFPFLATVRYMVATVVTVLTVVVVAMVITVALRPEEIRFSIDDGYIWANKLWSVSVIEISGGPGGDVQVDVGQGSFSGGTQQVRTYWAADSVTLRVYLSAQNPSGRASVGCNITAIRVLDMPNAPLFTGMVEIARFYFDTKQQGSHFSVPRQTSHSLRKVVTIKDESVLLYIVERYAGNSSFSAIVEVTATVSYEPLLSTKPHNVSQLHYCGPVTVGSDVQAADAVSCKKSEEMGWTVNSRLPAPAPAPAPVVVLIG